MLRPAALVLALGLVASACSESGSGPASGSGSGSGSSTTAGAASSAAGSGGAPVELAVTEVARGLEVPWALAWDPSGALWFTQRTGALTRLDGPSRDIAGVTPVGEGGLMGLEIDRQGRMFVMYTAAQDNRVVRLEPDGSQKVLVSGIARAAIHDGGRLRFGADGTLYASAGDARQPNLAPDASSLNGKVLKVDPNNGGATVFSRGHRNPEGLCFEPGGRFLSTEHGPTGNDEVNVLSQGFDGGWPGTSGNGIRNYSSAVAPAGCTVYSADLIPQWKGSMLSGRCGVRGCGASRSRPTGRWPAKRSCTRTGTGGSATWPWAPTAPSTSPRRTRTGGARCGPATTRSSRSRRPGRSPARAPLAAPGPSWISCALPGAEARRRTTTLATDLRSIPGVTAKRRRRVGSRHRDTWTFGTPPPRTLDARLWPRRRRRSQIVRKRGFSGVTLALAVGYMAAAVYGVNGVRSFMRVDVTVDGLAENTILTSAALGERSIRFAVRPAERIERTELYLDGALVPDESRRIHETSLLWRPGPLGEGRHEIVLSVPRPGMSDARFHRRFVIDDTPPPIGVPPLLEPSGVCEAVTVRGRVEPSSTLLLDGSPLAHADGTFTLRYDRPPAAPLQLTATDPAGNRTDLEVIAPVRYPGGQGVHVTAAGWGYEPLRKGILALVDAGLVSSVELDLKDEGGIIGYDSQIPLANQIGAVRPEYKLKETVAELKRRGVRVIGRVVAFRDAPLAKWAWENGRKDWVVQTPGGKMIDTYGGFTNLAHPDVHRYNLDVALEAADAGVDDILWDYVRRPEGDPATMVIPGLPDTSSTAIVNFLTMTHAALRERCVYQGASVFGIAADRPDAVGQDIPRIARHVDYIAPMLYPSHWVPGEYNVKNPNKQPYDIVKASLADFQAKMAGTGTRLVPWLQDFSLGHPYGPAEVRAQIDAAASLGVTDWLLWNAGATYTAAGLDASRVIRR